MNAKKTETILENNIKFNRQVLFVIFVFTFLIYGNSLKNNYALDDNYVTVTTPGRPNNPRIEKGIKGIPEIFKTHYVEDGVQSFEYRPIVLTTFAIEYQFFGSNPHVSHFISVLLYAFTGMLLFTILAKFFKDYTIIFPLLITFLFIIHPIHTEVVDNIKGRDELLSFLFGLLALHFYLKGVEFSNKIKRYIFISFLFLLCGLLCKQTTFLFIALIPLSIYFFSGATIKKTLAAVLILFLAKICVSLLEDILVTHPQTIREFAFFENPLFFEPYFFTRLPVACYTAGYYLKLLIFPYPLSCYYGYNVIPMVGWSALTVWFALLFYVFIGVYSLIKFPKKTILSFGILVFLVGIFPFANLREPVVGIVAERFVYFASLGFCIMAAYLLLILFKIDVRDKLKFKISNLSSSFKLALIGIFLVYAYLTVARNSKWKNELVLFKNDIVHFQNSCNLNYLLGNKLYGLNYNTQNGAQKIELINECKLHYKKAIELMQKGIQKYPQDFTTFNNIGMIYMKIFDDAPAAWPYFKQAVALNPKERMIQFNMALCYEKRNLPDSAILFYQKLITENTNYVLVYLNLHEIYFKKQAFIQAITCNRKGILQIPNYTKLYINLGNAFMFNKDTLNAVTQYINAVNCEPANTALRSKMKDFLISLGQKEKADKLNSQ